MQQTNRETLPPNFQSAELMAERGMVDEVVARRDLPARLGVYLRMRMPPPDHA